MEIKINSLNYVLSVRLTGLSNNSRICVRELSVFEKMEHFSNKTPDFLFEHYAVAKIPILTDMQTSKYNDNMDRNYAAYLPLVADCRPDWNDATVKRKIFYMLAVMQQMLLRYETASRRWSFDLSKKKSAEHGICRFLMIFWRYRE